MSDFTFVIAVGRFGVTAADGADADENPDTIWCDEGVVRFTPLNTYTKVTGGAPLGWTAGHSVINVPIDTNGFMSMSGTKRAQFVDLTSASVNPQIAAGKATHHVQFVGVKAQGTPVTFPEVDVRIAADTAVAISSSAAATALGLTVGTSICDLTSLMPVPTAGGTPIVIGPAGPGIASLAVTGNNLVATLTSGDTKTTALPTALTDSDAATGTRIGTPGTATRAALDTAVHPDMVSASAFGWPLKWSASTGWPARTTKPSWWNGPVCWVATDPALTAGSVTLPPAGIATGDTVMVRSTLAAS